MEGNIIQTKFDPYREFFEQNVITIILVVIWLIYFWELYLNLRQLKLMLRLENVPDSVSSFMTQEIYSKARAYSLDKNKFSLVKELYSNCLNTILIKIYAHYHCYRYSEMLAVYCGFDKQNEIIVSCFCVFIMSVAMLFIGLPFTIYNTFVLEQKHGFNKEKPLFFLKDQTLKFFVSQLLLLPILSGSIWIIKNGGDYFYLYLWVFTIIITLFIMIIYPEFIAPLFDKYSPLPEGDLKDRIVALANCVKFPLYKLFIVEGSKRSSHSNAYLYGFFNNKRIVLYDTLVKEYNKSTDDNDKKDVGCETEEVVAILCHELGHWYHSHVLKGFALTQVSFMFNILPFAKLMNYTPMYTAFGFTDVQPVFIGLFIVTTYFLIPLNTLFGFVMTVLTRKFEFEADFYAKKLGHVEHLKKGLIKLYKDNLGYPIFDKLYSGWYHDHPPLLERLETLGKDD